VLRKFVFEVGGTGKSFLINVLRKFIIKSLGKHVVVAGPTGVAARNVNGKTVHSLLNLPVHGSEGAELKATERVAPWFSRAVTNKRES